MVAVERVGAIALLRVRAVNKNVIMTATVVWAVESVRATRAAQCMTNMENMIV
jgi:hypothetical protein